jgi:preprotein translocase subunit SecG
MLLSVLLAIVIVICVAMVGVILLQKSEGGALGMSGGGPGNFMTARGTGDLLTRTTQILAAMFFALCLAMTLLSGHNHANSIVDRVKINGIVPAAPAGPATSTGPTSGPTPGQGVAGAPRLAPATRSAPTGQVGLFGETTGGGSAHAKPGPSGPANPLANITVQSSAPPANR